VHAQDRLWQMEATLRRGIGRWAEWVGGSGLESDKLACRLDGTGAARRDCDALPAETRGMLEAYVAGANAFIAAGRWPVEYRLLEAEPLKWQPWHCVAVMRQRGFLMGSVWSKLWRAAALRTIGPEVISSLRHDDSARELLCIPPGAAAKRWIATLADLAPALEAVAALGPADAAGGGSNNWALAPERTAAGRPLLAGDPHRLFELPSMYAQTHICCDELDVLGLSVPGVPGFPHYGHNGKVAWCVTHAFADIHDLYVERIDPARERYLFRDEWRPLERRRESIPVRGSAPAEIEVLATHHGPVIAGDPGQGAVVTLASAQYAGTDRSLACLLPMMCAANVEQLYESVRGWGLIDHNLVAADTEGHIGHLVRAAIPKRERINGWLPVPGWTGEHEWDGMVPFERLPRVIDPAGGMIVTANNKFVADDHPDYLLTDCHPPYRARRISQLLAALPAAGLADMPAIHMDVLSEPAREIRDHIAAAGPRSDAAIAIRDTIAAWDGSMSADSRGALLYMLVRRALTRSLETSSGLAAAARDPLMQVTARTDAVNWLWWSLPNLLRNDDTRLLGGRSWAGLIEAALEEVAIAAAGMDAPTWGPEHKPRFVHPLSPLFPDAAPLLDAPGPLVPGDGDCVFASGAICSGGLEATYGPIARYAFDIGAWDTGLWLVFHGASGHPGSAHYADQIDLWARGQLIPALYAWPRIEALAKTRQVLRA